VRTDSGPIVLQAVWGVHVEAMSLSGIGRAEYAARWSLTTFAAHLAQAPGKKCGNQMDWRSLLHRCARA
jgi:hypothetical protein